GERHTGSGAADHRRSRGASAERSRGGRSIENRQADTRFSVGDAVVSSERPKLGHDIPKVVTGWLSQTGRVVYLTKDRTWSEELADAEVLTGAGANDVLAWAVNDQIHAADPYF